MSKTFFGLLVLATCATMPAAAQTGGNTGVCNRIVENCSRPDETGTPNSGYGTFEACWADQGAPNCPEYDPDIGPHSYGNPYDDKTVRYAPGP